MARPPKGQPNKSAFIRELPNLTVAEVVAKGNEAGLAIAPALVYKVRGRKTTTAAPRKSTKATKGTAKKAGAKKAGAKKGVAKKAGAKKVAAKKAPAKKAVTKKAPVGKGATKKVVAKKAAKLTPRKGLAKTVPAGRGRGEASLFIRSQPTNLTAREVVERGAAAGVKFSTALVYIVRGRASKPAKAAKAAKPATSKRAVRPVGAAALAPAADELAFRRLVVGLGVSASRALITDVEERLAKLLG